MADVSRPMRCLDDAREYVRSLGGRDSVWWLWQLPAGGFDATPYREGPGGRAELVSVVIVRQPFREVRLQTLAPKHWPGPNAMVPQKKSDVRA
jgi:hypothetical protein